MLVAVASTLATLACVDDTSSPGDEAAGDSGTSDSQPLDTDTDTGPDPDELSSCPKVYIDPLPPGKFRLEMKLIGTPTGDVHGGSVQVAYFRLDDPDAVNCYELDPEWPGPGDVTYSFYMEVFLFDMETFQTPAGYMLHDCTPWDSCSSAHYWGLNSDYYLPVEDPG
ncbi:MAG: hypothetical protein KC457_25910 [Myxococcales bacterium]|nr:hypothetical protein [Myxococcales bacterium]